MFRAFLILNLAAALFAAGCSKSRPGAEPQVFLVKGVVVEVKAPEKKVVIKHEAIPNYMMAMTMPFDVKDTNELAGLEAGDPVAFRMTVSDTDGWIDQIRKTGPKTNLAPLTAPVRVPEEVRPLNEGDPLPEYQFIDQSGRPFSLSQFKGQVLAINFLFTRCPFPTMCPQAAKGFAEAQQKLLALSDGPKNWRLLTITIDPEYDKPDVLRSYAEMNNADPAHWTFATGSLLDITTFGQQFGLTLMRDEPGGLPIHNLRTVVVDASGRVRRIIAGNEWTADELVVEMMKAAAAK